MLISIAATSNLTTMTINKTLCQKYFNISCCSDEYNQVSTEDDTEGKKDGGDIEVYCTKCDELIFTFISKPSKNNWAKHEIKLIWTRICWELDPYTYEDEALSTFIPDTPQIKA